MTIPRQLAPTMGLAHGGDEFLEGSFLRDREIRDVPDKNELVQKITTSTNSQNDIYKIQDQEKIRVTCSASATRAVVTRQSFLF